MAREEIMASGTTGTCTWTIDAEGVLTIAPADGAAGTIGSYAGADSVPWRRCRRDIAKIRIAPGVSAGASAAYLFYGCTACAAVEGAVNLDTAHTADLFEMFAFCASLSALDLSGWDTSAATNFSSMFYGCSSLGSLDLSGWDTSGAAGMFFLFSGCTALRTVMLGSGFSFTGDGSTACALPTPVSATYGTGCWADGAGEVYRDPADIPSSRAATYTAAFDTSDGYFADVADPGKWYYDAVYRMVGRGYLSGYTSGPKAGRFGPDDAMTRGGLVAALWRIACPDAARAGNRSAAANATGLADVEDGAPYTEAVNWACRIGVASGYSGAKKGGTFGVDDPVDFQSLCLMTARAAAGGPDVATRGDAEEALSAFADAGELSGWAVSGMAWCVENGLVSGAVSSGGAPILKPRAKVSRARAAVVLHRAVEAGLLGVREVR